MAHPERAGHHRSRAQLGFITLVLGVAILVSGCGAASEADGAHDSVAPGTAVLSWDHNWESDLAGYRVHIGRRPRIYDRSVDVGLTNTQTLRSLPSGLHYFAVTAYDREGNESSLSAEVSKDIE